jgi:hypothetical protein
LAHAFRIPLAIISHLLNHADSKDAFMTIWQPLMSFQTIAATYLYLCPLEYCRVSESGNWGVCPSYQAVWAVLLRGTSWPTCAHLVSISYNVCPKWITLQWRNLHKVESMLAGIKMVFTDWNIRRRRTSFTVFDKIQCGEGTFVYFIWSSLTRIWLLSLPPRFFFLIGDTNNLPHLEYFWFF